MRVTRATFRVKVYCMGMVSKAREFESVKDAEDFAAEMRRIPGFLPIIEEDYECV